MWCQFDRWDQKIIIEKIKENIAIIIINLRSSKAGQKQHFLNICSNSQRIKGKN